MSISNPDITSGDLEPCGSASMASDCIISEPLKPSITSPIMPLVKNMDIYQQSVNKLMQSQESGQTGRTRLTATTYNVIRFHLKRRQPSERITAGADTDRSLETKSRGSDSRSPKIRQALASVENGRLSEMKTDSRSPKVRKAVASPRQAVAQPRRTASNTELNPSLEVTAPSSNHDSNLPSGQVQAESIVEMAGNDFHNDEMPNFSGYSSGGTDQFTMDSLTQSEFSSWDNHNLELAKRQRNSMTYDQWLSLKRKQAHQLHRQRRREANRLAAAEQMRKEMSEKSYTEWLASKRKIRHHQSHCHQHSDEVSHSSKVSSGINQFIPHMQVLSDARPWRDRNIKSFRTTTMPLSSHRVQQWERNKVIEDDRRRLVKRQEQADREAEAEERRRLSKMAWDRWLDQLTGRSLAHRSRHSMAKKVTQRSNVQVDTLHRTGSLAGRSKISIRTSKPLSMAQRALRQRLNSIDGVQMYRNLK